MAEELKEVRRMISPKLHSQVTILSIHKDISMGELLETALEAYVEREIHAAHKAKLLLRALGINGSDSET